MTLYEIDEAIMNCFDTETGEMTDAEAFDELLMQRETKIENVLLWIKDLDAEAEAIKTEKMNLAKRQSAAENKAANLRKYVKDALAGERFQSAKVSVTYRTDKQTVLKEGFTDADVPLEYSIITTKPDKSKIRAAIENGAVIDFAEVVVNQNMIIR